MELSDEMLKEISYVKISSYRTKVLKSLDGDVKIPSVYITKKLETTDTASVTIRNSATFKKNVTIDSGGATITGESTIKGKLNITTGGMSVTGDTTVSGNLSATAFLVGNQNVITYIDNKYNELKARIVALEAVLQNSNQ